jgi:hypothetical protein
MSFKDLACLSKTMYLAFKDIEVLSKDAHLSKDPKDLKDKAQILLMYEHALLVASEPDINPNSSIDNIHHH